MYENMKTANDNYVAAMDNVAADGFLTENLLGRLKEFGDYTKLNTDEQKEFQAVIALLNQSFPELGLSIDEQTGELSKNIDELYKYAEAQQNAAKAEAYKELMKDNYKEIIRLERDRLATSQELEVFENKKNDAISKQTRLEELRRKVVEGSTEDLSQYSDLLEGSTLALDEYGRLTSDATNAQGVLQDLIQAAADDQKVYEGSIFKTNLSLVGMDAGLIQLNKTSQEYADEIVDLKEEELAHKDALTATGDAAVETGEKVAGTSENYNTATGAIGDAKEQTDGLDESLNKVGDDAQTMGDLVLEGTGKVTEGAGQLAENSDSIVGSQENILAATQQTGDSLNTYAGDLEVLNSRVLNSSGLVSSSLMDALAKAGPQAAGIVKYMVNASDTELQRLSSVFENGGLSAVQSLVDELGTTELPDSGKAAVDEVAEGVNSNQKLNDSINAMMKSAKTSAEKFIYDFQEIGRRLMDGLINGVNSKSGIFSNAMNAIIKNGLNAAKKAAGIASPSRVFRDEVGKMLAAGIGVGFEMETPRQFDVMEGVMRHEQTAMFNKLNSSNVSAGASVLGNTSQKEVASLLGLLERYLPELAEKPLVMDTGAVVGALAEPMDQKLGQIQLRRGRYA